MARTKRNNEQRRGRQRNISVRAVRRDPPDLRRLGRAVLQLAMEQAASEAAAEAERTTQPSEKPDA